MCRTHLHLNMGISLYKAYLWSFSHGKGSLLPACVKDASKVQYQRVAESWIVLVILILSMCCPSLWDLWWKSEQPSSRLQLFLFNLYISIYVLQSLHLYGKGACKQVSTIRSCSTRRIRAIHNFTTCRLHTLPMSFMHSGGPATFANIGRP